MKVPRVGLPAMVEGGLEPSEAPWWLHPCWVVTFGIEQNLRLQGAKGSIGGANPKINGK